MLNRTNIALIVLLVVQIIIGAGLALTSDTGTVLSDEPLLENFTVGDVTELIIEDDLGKEVQLVRGDDGWILPSADDFPVNSTQVEDVLSRVGAFTTDRLIATNPTSHARLEVAQDEFQRKLTLVTPDDNHVVYLGTGGGVDTIHTRLEGNDNVYLTSGLNSWEVQPQISSWIDTTYLDIEQDNVTRLILTNASGTYEFERDETGWAYLGLGEDEEFDSNRMSSLLRNATTVRMTQPLGLEAQDEYGMENPEITIQVVYEEPVESEADAEATDEPGEATPETTPEATSEPAPTEVKAIEKSYTITIGEPLGNGEYVLKATNKDYYVQVRSSYVTTFRNINHEALIVIPEEATNTPSG